MNLIVTFLLLLGFIVLTIRGIILAREYGLLKLENVFLLVLFALVYEHVVLFIGRWIGEGQLLETLNYVRYLLHAIVTPLLILFSWKSLSRINITWVQTVWMRLFIFVLTIGLIVYEFVVGVYGIKLEPKWEEGMLSYESVASAGFPLMVLVVTAVILITGLILWRKQKWPWLVVGVFVMIIGSFLMGLLKLLAFMNVFEWVLMYSLLNTKTFQDRVEEDINPNNIS